MSDDRLTLIAECHGDNILCNRGEEAVRLSKMAEALSMSGQR